MRREQFLWPLVVVIGCLAGAGHLCDAAEEADEQALRQAGVSADDAALLDFLRKQAKTSVPAERLRHLAKELGMLINLLVAEKAGFRPADNGDSGGFRELADRLTREALDSLQQPAVSAVSRADKAEVKP